MATDIHHAQSSAKKWGGLAEDYIAIHKWFDELSKTSYGDYRHRALRHHTVGVTECVEKFGDWIENSSGRKVSVRWIAEAHIIEDHGYIPSFADWCAAITPKPWMRNAQRLSVELVVNALVGIRPETESEARSENDENESTESKENQ